MTPCVNTYVLMWMCVAATSLSQPAPFVTRSGSALHRDGRPFYFLGANAYYLMEESARGDTASVKALLTTARQLGMTVVRTWGFFDSSDSLNPAVIQWRPGTFNENALRALDFVVWQARQLGLRLIIPLVNSWDDYGGMNQYVRWRMEQEDHGHSTVKERYTQVDQQRIVIGANGKFYRVALDERFGHDDFYADRTIRLWYTSYMAFLVRRVNSFSGVAYKDEPAILAWELANEPRSSDPSGLLVSRWLDDVSAFLKHIDTNHLVGTGEEGFENSSAGYSIPAYNNQLWLFNGSAGVSFSLNSALSHIDFAGIHLYPQSWGLANGAGNVWIDEHIRVAAAVGKPVVLGEFGVLADQPSTYDSWLTTILLDGGSGAMVWQLSGGARRNNDGYGIRCPESGSVCTVLQYQAAMFNGKSVGASPVLPSAFLLYQNYPNPFNGQTTIAYSLPADAHVTLSLYNSLGQAVGTIVGGFRHAGIRKELLEVGSLSSGAYFYRADIRFQTGQTSWGVRKFIVVR